MSKRTVTFDAENLGVSTAAITLNRANASTNVGEGYKWGIGLDFTVDVAARNTIPDCNVMERHFISVNASVSAAEIAAKREITEEDVGSLTYAQIEDSLVEIAVGKAFLAVFGKIPENVSFAK
jgi:hypothetical protein